MKTKIKLIVFVVSILYSGITSGQNEYVTLTSAQIIEGLDNIDSLRAVLIENGFTAVKQENSTKPKFYESWQYNSLIYVDIIKRRGRENLIIVAVHESFTGLPERLLQSFPRKKNKKRDEHLANIGISPINKETSHSLIYARDNDNVGVYIWYDYPYYYFQYSIEK
jgi:hypothetical protein